METGEVKIMSKITLEKDKCVNCKRETLYGKETHIDFRLGYVEGAGQLCFECSQPKKLHKDTING